MIPETTFAVSANVVDVMSRRIYPAEVAVRKGRIGSIRPLSSPQRTFLLPGFIDAHLHIESSMLVPREFARGAVLHGTVRQPFVIKRKVEIGMRRRR